jgi:Ni/Co efflux regulator RcnB
MTTKNAKNFTNKTYLTKIVDANDDTGDGILILPEEVVKYNHWKEGQAIEMEYKEGKVYLKALSDQSVV